MTLDVDPQLYAAIKKVRDLGGFVAPDNIAYVSAGTGTTRTSISTTYQIPTWANMILAIKPKAYQLAAAATTEVLTMFDIQGGNYKGGPTQVIGPTSGPNLSVSTVQQLPTEFWQINTPCKPLATYDWGVTPLVANSGNIRAGYEILFSSIDISNLAGFAPIVSQVSAVQTASAAGNTSFNNAVTTVDANDLVEVGGAVLGNSATDPTASQTAALNVTLQSTGLQDLQQITYGLDPTNSFVGASGNEGAVKINRVMTSGVRFKSTASVINYQVALDEAVTNAYNAAQVIRYHQTGI
jgi:hypothetical protein